MEKKNRVCYYWNIDCVYGKNNFSLCTRWCRVYDNSSVWYWVLPEKGLTIKRKFTSSHLMKGNGEEQELCLCKRSIGEYINAYEIPLASHITTD